MEADAIKSIEDAEGSKKLLRAQIDDTQRMLAEKSLGYENLKRKLNEAQHQAFTRKNQLDGSAFNSYDERIKALNKELGETLFEKQRLSENLDEVNRLLKAYQSSDSEGGKNLQEELAIYKVWLLVGLRINATLCCLETDEMQFVSFTRQNNSSDKMHARLLSSVH